VQLRTTDCQGRNRPRQTPLQKVCRPHSCGRLF
jgi:hypothetical protein